MSDRLVGGYSPEAFEKPLHDYQETAVDFLLDKLYFANQEIRGAGLFLDPGLGKTRISLAFLDIMFNLNAIKRALVIAPLGPIGSVWEPEMIRWGFPQSRISLHNQHATGMTMDCQIEFCNWESLSRLQDIRNRWDVIICDESTYAKNWGSKRIKYLRKMLQTIPRRIILTGDPAENVLSDIFAQMFIVDGGASLGKTVSRFRAQFCELGGWRGQKWRVTGGARRALRGAIADDVLRMDCRDYLDMPELLENDIYVNMPEPVARQYTRLKRELIAELDSGKVFAANASAAYIKCRQFANGSVFTVDEDGQKIPDKNSIAEHEYIVTHKEKIRALVDLVEGLHGKPLLLFYTFKHELAEFLKLPQFKNSPVMYGRTKPEDKTRIAKEWNQDKHAVLICQWQAASHGWNLQEGSCNDVACFGLIDSPGRYKQAYKRVWRQGVTGNQVRVHRFLTRETVDEVQLARVKGRIETQNEFLDALRAHAKSA